MASNLDPDTGILFMKVGIHAQESLEDIIARKSKEIDDHGFALWGYGGNTCHPRTMVQPFAEQFEQRGSGIVVCMERMDSRHFAPPVPAHHYSSDGTTWEKIPSGIEVRGSRYALVINNLREQDLELPLARTRVAVGLSRGRAGHDYIKGRVDKACLELHEPTGDPANEGEPKKAISLVADVCTPYAVFVKE